MYNNLYLYKTARAAAHSTSFMLTKDGIVPVTSTQYVEPAMPLADTADNIIDDYRESSRNKYLNAIDAKYKPGIGVYLDRHKGKLAAGAALTGLALSNYTKEHPVVSGLGVLGIGALAAYPAFTNNEKHRRLADITMDEQDTAAYNKLLANRKFENDVLTAAKKVDLVGDDAAYRSVLRNASSYGIPKEYKMHSF